MCKNNVTTISYHGHAMDAIGRIWTALNQSLEVKRGESVNFRTILDGVGCHSGGRCEIRTHEDLATLPVFKTGAFNRSANLPNP